MPPGVRHLSTFSDLDCGDTVKLYNKNFIEAETTEMEQFVAEQMGVTEPLVTK